MTENSKTTDSLFKPIENPQLLDALTELGRAINLTTTYGKNHPAVHQAIVAALKAMQVLFSTQKKILLGVFNGVLTVDEQPVRTNNTLLKSLERRLARLHITGLRLAKGIDETELVKLSELLSNNESEAFLTGIGNAGLTHIASEDTRYQAVHEGQTVANESDLAGMGGDGVLVLDDGDEHASGSMGENTVHVEQIVAFLKGDVDLEDQAQLGEELTDLASDPNRLGQMIMESVSIRQEVSELSGESLNDIILGCLRRTYDGLRKQPAFKTSEGVADLRKALLLLEESLLEKMRNLAGDADPEMDRQIVQSIREMDENLGLEQAAMEYMEHRNAIEENKQQLQSFIKSKGAESASEIISDTGFPSPEWRRIVVESEKGSDNPPIAAGLNTLATVFEKLEALMKSEGVDGKQVRELLGEANDNLDDTLYTTKGKLEELSRQLKEGESGTIGGQGRNMTQNELLSVLSEVAQELMQPLTAINTSLEMMMQGYVGEVSDEQRDLLGLASNSGEHLKYLMRELIDIVGCPTNKGVDVRYHTTSDQIILMQDAEGQEKFPFSQAQ